MSRWLRGLAGGAVLVLSFGGSAYAAARCEVVDSFRDFLALSERTASLSDADQIQAFNRDYRARYADLYVPTVIIAPGPRLDAVALAGLKAARTHPEWREADATLTRGLPEFADRFATAFPDFRCDFPIYLTATFGVLDGAGRVVASRPSMVVGVDTVSAVESASQLPVFFTHELFHRYHFQAAGFSDDLGDKSPIWRALWAEGLATYVSARLNPSHPLADAWLLPRDLDARSRPLLPVMAGELAGSLDQVDAKVYGKFFEYGDRDAERAGWPSRAGYYLGYLVAEDLARRHPLADLPHLKGPALRREIGEAVGRLVGSPPPAQSSR